MTSRINAFATLAFVAVGFLSQSGAGVRSTQPDRYLAERGLGGLKVKVADNLTLGCWSALYYGTSYFPNRLRFDPLRYQGYDIVPGFVADLGKIIGNAKVSLGGEFYYMWRNLEYDFEPSIIHYRIRGNATLSVPFAGNFNMTVIQRCERIMQQKWLRLADPNTDKFYGEFEKSGPANSFFRYRTTFKVSAPPFTSLKITPYAYYEGFSYIEAPPFPVDPYYFESEIGASFSPAKEWSFSLADQIQSTPERRGWETHQISFYCFYTLDLSKKILEWTKK